MTLPKVLVGVVVYDGKEYVWDKFYNNIKNFSYPNFDICIIDNSETKKFYSRLKKKTKLDKNCEVFHVNRGMNSREAQAKSLNKLRDYFLAGEYSHLMMIESDLIPPTDIIERLMFHNMSVVGSIYLIGYAGSTSEPPRPCLFSVDPNHKKRQSFGSGTRNLPPDEGFAFFGNGLVQIHGCGFGSTLFKRWVLEDFKFWYDLNDPIKHSDVLFFKDFHNEGYRAYVDTDLIIPHYNSNWNTVKDI